MTAKKTMTKKEAFEFLKDKYVPLRSETEAKQAMDKMVSVGLIFKDSLGFWVQFPNISISPFDESFGFYSADSVMHETELSLSDLLAIEIVEEPVIKKTKLYDPKRNKPRQSPDDITFSETVFIIDEEGLHGLAYFSFADDKWYFLTDTLVDYDEPGAETEWKWYYPEVQWSESSEAPDPSELLKEAVWLLKQLSFAAQTTGGTVGPDKGMQEVIERVGEFLTKHSGRV